MLTLQRIRNSGVQTVSDEIVNYREIAVGHVGQTIAGPDVEKRADVGSVEWPESGCYIVRSSGIKHGDEGGAC